MKKLLLTAAWAVIALLALTGMAEHAFALTAFFALAEILSLLAADMLRPGCAMELNEDAALSRQADAWLLTVIGALLAVGAAQLAERAGVPMPEGMLWLTAPAWILARLLTELFRLNGAKAAGWLLAAAFPAVLLIARFSPAGFALTAAAGCAAVCIVSLIAAMASGAAVLPKKLPKLSLLRWFPDALKQRGCFVIPAFAALTALKLTGTAETAFSCAAGFAVFALLSCEDELIGEERQRFLARWLAGAALTAAAAVLNRDGAFSGAYCALGVICAMLSSGGMNGKSLLCALLTLAAAACAVLPFPARAAAVVPVLLAAAILRENLYSAWLPVRAWFIRRRTIARR